MAHVTGYASHKLWAIFNEQSICGSWYYCI